MGEKRQRTLSQKAADTENVAEPAISAHRRKAAVKPSKSTKSGTKSTPAAPTTSTNVPPQSSSASSPAPSSSATPNTLSTPVINVDDDESADGGKNQQARKRPRIETEASTDAESSAGEEDVPKRQEEKTRDIGYFFPDSKTFHTANGATKKRQCDSCKKKGQEKWLVCEASTLRRHMESFHKGLYYKWTEKNHFNSMLPKDRQAEKEAKSVNREATLDPHLKERPPPTRVVKYSDPLFKQVALEWLAATDQPISALQHPKFKEMIDVASRAENGVVIPSQKETRRALLDLFNKNLVDLKKRLNGTNVGEVSLTCDAWQASNTDAYYAVTGHWIEETSPGVWEQRAALFGFTRMNTAHDGVRLGRALYRIVRRLNIAHKIGWITCDNATNNGTMLRHFEQRLNADPSRRDKKKWDHRSRHIRCLAHVINLAMQAILNTYSKAKYFNPHEPDEHEPDVLATDRDEVGLVCAIAVKVRSSAKRKELFRQLQGPKPLNLILDMPVRWSSSFAMMKRASALEKHVTEFLYRAARDEKDADKSKKLQDLVLSTVEWKRIHEFMQLLGFADNAQQSFSSDQHPSLNHALPALEALHSAWSSRAKKTKYDRYKPALEAGIEKIGEYYNKISTSHVYTLAMILDPEQKLSHFDAHWDPELKTGVRNAAEEMFKARYIELYGHGPPPAATTNKGSRKLRKLLAELSSDDEELPASVTTGSSSSTETLDTSRPWLGEFNRYLNATEDEFAMTTVQWWGLNAHRYPVWASLARDHLAIMASSVSSERAFSSAGITISKRRNRLKGNIVEALQFLKCALRKDLLFREEVVIPLTEEERIQAEEEDADGGKAEEAWDNRLQVADNTTDDDFSGIDDDDNED